MIFGKFFNHKRGQNLINANETEIFRSFKKYSFYEYWFYRNKIYLKGIKKVLKILNIAYNKMELKLIATLYNHFTSESKLLKI